MTTPEAAYVALTSAVRLVVDEAMPSIVERLVPVLLAELKASGVGGNRPENGPVYISVKTAAEVMSAHPVTVRRLIADGKLSRYSVEGQLRVKVTDIHAYMAREGGPSSPTIDLTERALALLGHAKPSNDT
jgi:excisionase family DNA binding protein